MFGFLGSPCHTCSPRDTHSIYRSFFCGLSGALRDDYSPAARFLVNRDSTFLSLMTAAISGQVPSPIHRTCCNPISVPKPLFKDGLHAQYAAAVTVCGLATKLDDDRHDEKGLRRFAVRHLGNAISGMTDRATSFLNTIGFPTAEVVEMMRKQNVVEQRNPNLLEAAAPTAMAYGTIFRHAAGIAGASTHRDHFQSIGRQLGRLIYWKDAHDDRRQDARRDRFNPLARAKPGEFGERFTHAAFQFDSLTRASPFKQLKSTIEPILSSTLSRHQPLLAVGSLTREQREHLATLQLAEQARSEKERHRCLSCCDNLACCSLGGEAACCLSCEAISCCS